MASRRGPVDGALRGPIGADALALLCRQMDALLASSPATVVDCDVSAVRADVAAVDALARLQLAARRRGRRIRLVGASPDLRALIGFMGLRDALLGC